MTTKKQKEFAKLHLEIALNDIREAKGTSGATIEKAYWTANGVRWAYTAMQFLTPEEVEAFEEARKEAVLIAFGLRDAAEEESYDHPITTKPHPVL